MGERSFFQIGILIAFLALAVIGVALFALGIGPSWNKKIGPVVIWGTFERERMDLILGELRGADERFEDISYVPKDPRTIDSEFVNALASGRGPDLIFLTDETLYLHRDKIIPLPFDSYSERNFKDTFADVSDVFIAQNGIRALPVLIDPLVMYWNRDIIADVALSAPPKYWDEFLTVAPKVTQRDASRNIVRSFVAFGEYRNVDRAKDIMAMLLLQTGNPIVIPSGLNDGGYTSSLMHNFNFATLPSESALRFYTEFSNPTKIVYSWNRALPQARHSFMSGDLALYFDFASEYPKLRAGNPNLNFDVTEVPQSRDASRRVTLGHTTALAMARGSQNVSGAFEVMTNLTAQRYVKEFSNQFGLPPSRRDLLGQEPQDPAQVVFLRSAIAALSWLDPSDRDTDGIFQRLIDSVLSGRVLLPAALQTADQELKQLLGR
jgi:ABC-type glycerol-3-phosphate transport system substrate-binding protein